MPQLTGLIPNMLTPMDSKGHPDPESIQCLVDFLIDSGVGGLWILGSAGEDVHLSGKDKAAVINASLAAINGRVPSVMGLGTGTFHDYMELCSAINTDAVDAFHFLPYDLKLGDARLIDYVTLLADSLPSPLWLYHNPKRGRPFTLPVVGELKQHPNIAGIKVGGYSLTDLTNMMMLKDSSFEVSGAGGGQMFQMLSLGADIHMTSDANCYPEVFLELFDLYNSGKRDEALALQGKIIRLTQALPRTDNGEYAAEEKYVLTLRGVLPNDNVNPAYRTLAAGEKTKTRALLKEFGFSWA